MLVRIRNKTLMLLSVAILLRAIIPVGYMPGSLQSGLLFELCPEGLPAELIQSLSGGHQHHMADDAESAHSFEACAIGHLAVTAATASFADFLTEPPVQTEATAVAAILFRTAPVRAYSSRAPPVVS